MISTDIPLIDITTMQRVGGQLGSNPAGIFQDHSGRRYYVKILASAALAINEIIAVKLYQLAGAPTLTYAKTREPNQIATEWIQLDKKCISHFSEDECKQAQRWFAVHAWTANWDAAGFHGDNQGVVNGKVLTLDLGGALEFRAQGDPKGNAFGSRVAELDVMRRDVGNPYAVKLFADMSLDDINLTILLVVGISDEQIRQVIIDNGGSRLLADKMVERKEDMKRYLKDLGEKKGPWSDL